MREIDKVYIDICKKILKDGIVIHDTKGRTSEDTREIRNFQFTIHNPKKSILSVRNLSYNYLCGELSWYMIGSNDLKYIAEFGSLWNKMTDDGKTVNSAYGDIIFNRHNFNQLDTIINLLKTDKNSRRAVININVPNKNVITTHDEPCTICLQFLIRDEKLHLTAMMRSNDIWFGLPYDIIFFTCLQQIVANELNVDCGTYTHFASSLHMYLRDEDKIKDVIKRHSQNAKYIDALKLYNERSSIYNDINKDTFNKRETKKYFEDKKILNDERSI